MGNVIEYNGRKFYASSTNPKYYYADLTRVKGKRKKIGLHQKIYIDNYGPIPVAHEIHHIDGNAFNNNPSNLEAKPIKNHRSDHMKERFKDPAYYQKSINVLKSGAAKRKIWHESEAGKRHHREIGAKSWTNKEKIVKECPNCGNLFSTVQQRTVYCCNKCWQMARYKNKTDFEARSCIVCSANFDVRKNDKAKTCSMKCAAKSRKIKTKSTEFS